MLEYNLSDAAAEFEATAKKTWNYYYGEAWVWDQECRTLSFLSGSLSDWFPYLTEIIFMLQGNALSPFYGLHLEKHAVVIVAKQKMVWKFQFDLNVILFEETAYSKLNSQITKK